MTTTETRVFSDYTHVSDVDGRSYAFGPGDPVPGWALPLVGEHVLASVDGYVRSVVEEPIDDPVLHDRIALGPDDVLDLGTVETDTDHGTLTTQVSVPAKDLVFQGVDPGLDEFDPPGHHDGSTELVAPPVAGPGSNRPAWATFADDCGVTVSSSMSRQDIINALKRRGLVT